MHPHRLINLLCSHRSLLDMANPQSRGTTKTGHNAQTDLNFFIKPDLSPNTFALSVLKRLFCCSSVPFSINPYPAEHDNPYLCEQCRSRSDGFCHLTRIHTVFHVVCELNEYITFIKVI